MNNTITTEELQNILERQHVRVTSDMLPVIIREGFEYVFTEEQLSDYNFKKAWARKVLKADMGGTIEGRLVFAMEVCPVLDEYVDLMFG